MKSHHGFLQFIELSSRDGSRQGGTAECIPVTTLRRCTEVAIAKVELNPVQLPFFNRALYGEGCFYTRARASVYGSASIYGRCTRVVRLPVIDRRRPPRSTGGRPTSFDRGGRRPFKPHGLYRELQLIGVAVHLYIFVIVARRVVSM